MYLQVTKVVSPEEIVLNRELLPSGEVITLSANRQTQLALTARHLAPGQVPARPGDTMDVGEVSALFRQASEVHSPGCLPPPLLSQPLSTDGVWLTPVSIQT